MGLKATESFEFYWPWIEPNEKIVQFLRVLYSHIDGEVDFKCGQWLETAFKIQKIKCDKSRLLIEGMECSDPGILEMIHTEGTFIELLLNHVPEIKSCIRQLRNLYNDKNVL